MKLDIDRRMFLLRLSKASAGLVCLSSAVVPVWGADASSSTSHLREERIDAFAGEIYLKMFPEERDLNLLTQGIWKADARTVETFGSDRIRNLLSHAIKSDYRKGDVVNLNGWRMSRSESRFFALQALLVS